MESIIQNNLQKKVNLLIRELKIELENNIKIMESKQAAQGSYNSGSTIRLTIELISLFINQYYEDILEHLKNIVDDSNQYLEKYIFIIHEGLNNNKEYLISKLKNIINVVGSHKLDRLYETEIPKVEEFIINRNDTFKNELEAHFLSIKNNTNKFRNTYNLNNCNANIANGNNIQQQITNNPISNDLLKQLINEIKSEPSQEHKENKLVKFAKEHGYSIAQIALGIIGIN